MSTRPLLASAWRAAASTAMLLGSFFAAERSAGAQTETAHLRSGNKDIAYDVFSSEANGPVVILLPGTSGPANPYYQQQARFFQKNGSTVLLLHYFDAGSSNTPTDANYNAWATAVQALVTEYTGGARAPRPIVLVGYSLGASIALAAGSEGVPVAGIAEWYGSLPDSFFYRLRTMPPLLILHGERDSNIPVMNAQQLIRLCAMRGFSCQSHLYPDQEHGFSGAALDDADGRTLAFLRERTSHNASAP